jgi:citrate synthase
MKEDKMKNLDLSIIHATIGDDAFYANEIHEKTGNLVFDPGFMSTASCKSKITYIDGDNGILMHRGYKIEDLATFSNFEEVAYIVLYGEIPSKERLEQFSKELNINDYSMDRSYIHIISSFSSTSHPMPMIMSCLSALAAFMHGKDISKEEKIKIMIHHMFRVVSMVVRFKISSGNIGSVSSDENMSFAQNFISSAISASLAKDENIYMALDKILLLHIDHEQNASTSTLRMVSSTQCDLFGSVVSAMGALWGPLHGGANEKVVAMLEEIGDESNIPAYIEAVKKKDKVLMGFGHRIYKNYDPRAGVMKNYSDKILDGLNVRNKLLSIAKKIEDTALSDDYFKERKLFPNVDFYSGVIYKALGLPIDVFTPMFALARVVGWSAQWFEQTNDGTKIWRPRQIYNGFNKRDFTIDKKQIDGNH